MTSEFETRSSPVSATIFTGFLGAGKTSLIERLIRDAPPLRLALIINEFGELGLDGDRLRNCGLNACAETGEIVELANGCLCCTVADDFIPAMESILARDPRPDHIVIETSGLAMPQPLVKAFRWPQIRHQVRLDGVIGIVDGPALRSGDFAANPEAVDDQRRLDPALDHQQSLRQLFTCQIDAADLVVITKTDQLSSHELRTVTSRVRSLASGNTRLINSTRDALPHSVLLAGENPVGHLDQTPLVQAVRSHPDHDSARDHTHATNHETDHDHDHDAFTSHSWKIRSAIDDRFAFESRIRQTMERYSLFRLKGFVAETHKTMKLEIQAVGTRVETCYGNPWEPDQPREGRVTAIGPAHALRTVTCEELASSLISLSHETRSETPACT